jgi:hypothetical protein
MLWFGHAAEDTVKDAWMEFRHLHGRRGYRHRYYTLYILGIIRLNPCAFKLLRIHQQQTKRLKAYEIKKSKQVST